MRTRPTTGRRGGPEAAGGAAGLTVLELLLVLLIVFLALLIAARLMIEAQRRSAVELRRTLDPAVPIALKQLRADVTAARRGSGIPDLDQPMTLHFPSGLRIAYELTSSELVRRFGDPAGQRVLLTGVRSFQWLWISDTGKPSVLIEVTYEKTRRAGPEVADGRRLFAPRALETQTLVLTLRGGGGRSW